jgi:hypothetical protein
MLIRLSSPTRGLPIRDKTAATRIYATTLEKYQSINPSTTSPKTINKYLLKEFMIPMP